MRKELEVLRLIQGQDMELTELQEKIEALKRRREGLQATMAKEKDSLAAERQRLAQMCQESRRKNAEVDDLDFEVRNHEKRLNEGLMSFKEMEALREKILHLRGRIEELEDEALELMMAIEKGEQKLKEQEASFARKLAKTEEEIRRVEKEIEGLQLRVAQGKERRAQLANTVSPQLLERYERLREEYEDPVVAIKGGSCSGCKLGLSETTIERARESLEIATCENCSRILYAE